MARSTGSWIRSNALGLVAIFIAIGGSASGLVTGGDGRDSQLSSATRAQPEGYLAKTSKSRRGPRGLPGPAGPQGAQGPQGTQGIAGQNGSPDTPAQILSKLLGVDGPGSGLSADTLDIFNSSDFALVDSGYVDHQPPPDSNQSRTVLNLGGLGRIDVSCSRNGPGIISAQSSFVNESPFTLSVAYVREGSPPEWYTVTPGNGAQGNFTGGDSIESFIITAQDAAAQRPLAAKVDLAFQTTDATLACRSWGQSSSVMHSP